MLGAALQQIGITSTTVTNAGFLTALYVPLVPLLAWLILQTPPHWSVWPTSLGCLAGTWLLSGAQGLDPVVGDLWVIASSIFWALHVLFVGRVAERIAAPFLVACGQFLVCGLISLLGAGLSETITLAGIRQAWLPIVYAGVVSVAIGFTAQVVGQRYAQPADAAIILSAETVFAALFGFLLMGDRLSASGIAGCALILVLHRRRPDRALPTRREADAAQRRQLSRAEPATGRPWRARGPGSKRSSPGWCLRESPLRRRR
jgi:drug/metabolite transporter (DMT)-like permease